MYDGRWRTDRARIAALADRRDAGGVLAGAGIYRDLLGQAPSVYGRRRFGLSPLLPQILSRLGFIGAVHATLDDGRFATASQSKVRWEGLDYSAIDALTRLPLDANRPETFLGLPRTLGESMDRDHVATVVFGALAVAGRHAFYGDLRRMAAYRRGAGPSSLRWPIILPIPPAPGELIKFKADGYRSPYLRQAVAQANRSRSRRYGQACPPARAAAIGAWGCWPT